MAFKYFKTFEQDGISSGSSYSTTWYPDEDIVIRRIYIKEKGGSSLLNSEFYLKVKEDVYTLDVAPASLFTGHANQTPRLDINVPAHSLINLIFYNNEASSVSVYIVFECWEPE